MILSSLLAFAAIAVAAPAGLQTRMELRGLNRLRNSTLAGRAVFPNNGFHGVNLGAWFVFEPYMAVDEWHSMGGDWLCGDCTQCVNDEFALTQKLGQDEANRVFKQHWQTFITQDDVNLMAQYGINAVRIPIGFWIIEDQVHSDEHYPQGGLDVLRAGCKMLKNAGISVLLDLHAAPGAQTSSNPFTGRCLAQPQFWQQDNFDRMNNAAAKLTEYIHNEPDNFGSVWGLQALNEPPTDGNQTPQYYQFMQQFNAAVRGKESSLSVPADQQISTVYMDVSWQWQNNAGNPAYVSNGGNAYDSHVYYSFGAPCGNNGCVEENLSSHVSFACQGAGGRIGNDAQNFNTPSFMGEFWLMPLGSTCNAFDKGCIQAFGDAQKRGYSPEGGQGGFGWFFWSWKMTNSDDDGSNHLRSYKDAVQQGYLPQQAGSYFNDGVCG